MVGLLVPGDTVTVEPVDSSIVARSIKKDPIFVDLVPLDKPDTKDGGNDGRASRPRA